MMELVERAIILTVDQFGQYLFKTRANSNISSAKHTQRKWPVWLLPGIVSGVMPLVLGKVFLAAPLCSGQLIGERQRAKPGGHTWGKS